MRIKRNVWFLLICLSLLNSNIAHAASEWVYVFKVMDDNSIIVRKNKQAYQIEKGVGCLSLWRYEGKAVLISSPGLFLGVGSKLLIPDVDQQCRIWNSSELGDIDNLISGSSKKTDSGCEDGHWIESVSSNGEIIKLEDGSIWQVDSIDTITSSIWLPISNITICGSTLINTDDGEKGNATRLK
jgi:hypothetical protein